MSYLRDLGHDVTAISQEYDSGLADEEVLKVSRREQRILVVADQDFGELVFRQRLSHVGIVLFRLPGASLETKIRSLNALLAGHGHDLQRGEFLVVSRDRIRVARLL